MKVSIEASKRSESSAASDISFESATSGVKEGPELLAEMRKALTLGSGAKVATERFEDLVKRSSELMTTPQADPSFNGTPSVHQPPPGLGTDEISRRANDNREYLLKMWKQQDPSLKPEQASQYMKLLEKDHNLASVAIQDIRESKAQLNVQQTAYLLTVYGEAGTVANGRADFQAISTHDCITVTRNLTALEGGRAISSLREAREGMSGKDARAMAEKMPRYKAFLVDDSALNDDGVESLDREKRFLDSRSTFARLADLQYLPVSEKPAAYQLQNVAKELKVGDVLYAPAPKMQPGFSKPAFHAMKVVGQNEQGEFVVFQIDAANPQVSARLMTLKQVEAALKPETTMDIYRKQP